MALSNLENKSVIDLQEELDQIISWFQSEDVDLEAVEQRYKDGLEVAHELKSRIAKIENSIRDIKESLGQDE